MTAGHVSLPPSAKLVIITDCLSAMALMERNVPPHSRWMLWHTIRRSLEQLKLFGLEIQFTWVPSHNREVRSWIPHAAFGEAALRAFNDRAD